MGERIRLAVRALDEEHLKAPGGRVTVSVGVATARPGGGRTAGQVLEAADLSLHQAERAGRNRVGPMAADRFAA